MLKEKGQLRIVYPPEVYVKNEMGMKTLADERKLSCQQSCTIRNAKGVFWFKGKW